MLKKTNKQTNKQQKKTTKKQKKDNSKLKFASLIRAFLNLT